MSREVRVSNLPRSRYIAEAKTRPILLILVAAFNFVWVATWLTETLVRRLAARPLPRVLVE